MDMAAELPAIITIHMHSPQHSTQHMGSPFILSHQENTVVQQILQLTLEAVLRLSLDAHERFSSTPTS